MKHNVQITFLLITCLLTPTLSYSSDMFGKTGALALTAGVASALAVRTGFSNAGLQTRLTTLEQQIEESEAAHTAHLQSLALAAGYQGKLTFELVEQDIKTKVAALELVKSKIPQNDEQTTFTNELQQKLEQKTAEIKEAQSEIENLKKLLLKSHEQRSEIKTNWEKDLKLYKKAEAHYLQQTQDLQREIKNLQEKVQQLQLEQAQYCSAQELEQAQNQVATLTTERDKNKKLIEGLIQATDEAEKNTSTTQAALEQKEKDLKKAQRDLADQKESFSRVFAIVAGMAGVDRAKVPGFVAKVQAASETTDGPSVLNEQEQQLVSQLTSGKLDKYFRAGKTTRLTTQHE